MDLFGNLANAFFAQRARRGVRRDVNFRVPPEGVRQRQRFGAEHIERGTRQMAAVDQPDQVFIDQVATARHIDDITARLQPGQCVLPHDAVSLRRQGQQAYQNARCRQEIVETGFARKALHAGNNLG